MSEEKVLENAQDTDFQTKMNYKTQKRMKKLYGRNLGTEIAFGRHLLEILKTEYQSDRLSSKDKKGGMNGRNTHST